MRALVNNHLIAESDDVVTHDGYCYFPPDAVRRELLQQAPRTEADRACPHGVQFYDVVIDGARYPRAAWCYEAPRPPLAKLAGRFGFWQDVAVV